MSVDPSSSEPWRAAYPFESHWLAGERGRLHYLDEGSGLDEGPGLDGGAGLDEDGPEQPEAGAILFVHGNPTWSFHWRRLIEALRPTHRCVAIDHLGCGLSDKPQRPHRLDERIADLGRLIDELDLRRVTLVAQDWGGAIGLGAMLDRQDRLERVLLFNTGAFPPPFVPKRIAVCRTPLLGKLALQGMNLFSLAALRMTLSRRAKLDAPTAAAYLAPYNNWPNRRAVYEFVADIPRRPSDPTWKTLERIEFRLSELRDLPKRLVWGMEDWCFTPECLERFLQHWPDAEAVRLEGVGHWVVEDAPEESLRQLQAFVTGGASQPAPAVAATGQEG